jgi:hypothetical protein
MRLTPKTKERLKMLRAVMLDEHTKVRMRDALDAYVDLHEVQGAVPARRAIPSPFFFYASFSRMGTSVLAFAVLLLVGGTGAAYAAEGSVPGNVLYLVKVAVVEPLQGALITNAEGQAAWHANLASRRLEEATKLAVADKLDSQTQIYLQDKFNTEVTKSSIDADTLVATGNTNAALDVRSDLEARITAHAQILGLVTDHLEATAPTNPSLEGTRALLAVVQERKDQITSERIALEGGSDTTATVAIATPEPATIETPAADTAAPTAQSFAPMAARMATAPAPMAKHAEIENTVDETPVQDDPRAAERASEVDAILLQHASLLRSLQPIGTSTASSTTATTTPKLRWEVIKNIMNKDQ